MCPYLLLVLVPAAKRSGAGTTAGIAMRIGGRWAAEIDWGKVGRLKVERGRLRLVGCRSRLLREIACGRGNRDDGWPCPEDQAC